MDVNCTLVHMLIEARFDSRFLDCIIGVLFHGLLASSLCFTVPALLLIQSKEIQRFDLTAAAALTSLCRGSFKSHGWSLLGVARRLLDPI